MRYHNVCYTRAVLKQAMKHSKKKKKLLDTNRKNYAYTKHFFKCMLFIFKLMFEKCTHLLYGMQLYKELCYLVGNHELYFNLSEYRGDSIFKIKNVHWCEI